MIFKKIIVTIVSIACVSSIAVLQVSAIGTNYPSNSGRPSSACANKRSNVEKIQSTKCITDSLVSLQLKLKKEAIDTVQRASAETIVISDSVTSRSRKDIPWICATGGFSSYLTNDPAIIPETKKTSPVPIPKNNEEIIPETKKTSPVPIPKEDEQIEWREIKPSPIGIPSKQPEVTPEKWSVG